MQDEGASSAHIVGAETLDPDGFGWSPHLNNAQLRDAENSDLRSLCHLELPEQDRPT
jgi:hypothetical protein